MQLKLWGTRGSLPRAGTIKNFSSDLNLLIDSATDKGIKTLPELKKALNSGQLNDDLPLGGHTACYEVSRDNYRAIVDMGSGLIEASSAALGRGQKQFEFFVTHMHWDHIIGLPFFVPLYQSDCEIVINHVHRNTPDHIRILFNGINFPLKWDDLSAKISWNRLKLYEPITRADMTIRPFTLDHPGGSFGYRFDCPDGSAALAVDSEAIRVTPEKLGQDLAFYQDLDVLLFDGQYDMNELASRFDWGHSSPPIGVDIVLREGIKNLILSHHDPQRLTSESQRMLQNAKAHAAKQLPRFKDLWAEKNQANGPNIMNAYDGMTIQFNKRSLTLANPLELE